MSEPVKRQCGSCQMCCEILEVREISKPRFTKCRWQRFHKGCTIYSRRPRSCQLWSCMWLYDQDSKIGRPDRVHYVLDMLPDTIAVTLDNGSTEQVACAQVWCDPRYPDAHRDPELRAYLLTLGVEGFALVRQDAKGRALLLIPPAYTDTGDWVEAPSNVTDKLPGGVGCQSQVVR